MKRESSGPGRAEDYYDDEAEGLDMNVVYDSSIYLKSFLRKLFTDECLKVCLTGFRKNKESFYSTRMVAE